MPEVEDNWDPPHGDISGWKHPSHSGAGNSPDSPLPFLPSRAFPDLGNQQPLPPASCPQTMPQHPPGTGQGHSFAAQAEKHLGGSCRALTHLVTRQKPQLSNPNPCAESGASQGLNQPNPGQPPPPSHPWVGSCRGDEHPHLIPVPAPPAPNVPTQALSSGFPGEFGSCFREAGVKVNGALQNSPRSPNQVVWR